MISPPRTLILGAAVGYGIPQLRPFLVSLARSGYRGDLCLLCSFGNGDPATLQALRAGGVKVEAFESWRMMPIELNTARYIRYLEVLLTQSCDAVLLTDTRDVIFQRDPFAGDWSAPLQFFLEHDDKTLDSCESNREWIEAAYGREKVRTLAGRPISCSGTTLGTREAILDYISAMIEAMGQVHPDSLKVTGIDQGIHNVLIQEGRFPKARLSPNGQHILTMGHLPRERVVLRPDGLLANPDGSVPAVVHQYNYPRHEDICRAVLARHR